MSTRATRWTVLVSLSVAVAAALALVFLLSIATNNRALYERHFGWLLWVNVSVTVVLGLVIVLAMGRLALRMRRGKFGSQLLFKLATIFALVGVLPGALIYLVSYQFVSRSIESWFDVKVEGALEAGLNLGRSTVQTLVNDLAAKTRIAAERAAEQPDRLQVLALERLREQLDAQNVAVLGANGQVQTTAGSALLPDRPSSALLREVRTARSLAVLEGLDEEQSAERPNKVRIRALAIIGNTSFSLGGEEHFLQVTQPVPPELAANALAVQTAYSEYQQRALGREGLRKMYIGALTLTLILAVFSAFLLAAALGHQLARPLLVLAEGVRRVAQGDLSRTEVLASRDELGGLTRAFADMTQQLSEARALAQRSLGAAESAKTHLQTILDNLTAGVMVFDPQGRLDTINPGATRILRVPLAAWRGRTLAEVPGLETFASEVAARFAARSDEPDGGELGEPGETGHWQASFDVSTGDDRAPLTLLLRGAPLPEGARLVVFDDITDIVSAQRSVAWAEVARRVAHEIKNPLTPIQLSAERLQFKLEAKLDPSDQLMLARSVATIVTQVQAMKQLVNEFRDYARLPAAKLEPLDLNALVGDVLALYGSAQESGRLAAQLAPALPAVVGDATQLRQVIHNLVQNAFDAVADQADGLVTLQTDALFAEDGRMHRVRLVVQDNGPGFSEKVLKRAFEPYVTTKTRGTGLGLAVVKKIADEHGAAVRVRNLQDDAAATAAPPQNGHRTGARVSLSFSRLGAPLEPPKGLGAMPIEASPPRAT
jgi:nitrogen fixation/metabolism regulation signal transduction histidine kinase